MRKTLLTLSLLATATGAQAQTETSAGLEEGGAGIYSRPYAARHGVLTETEMAMAADAWNYFATFTQEETGLANSVGNYPSTTLWDTASYVSAMVAAYELGLIDKREFDSRVYKLLATIRGLKLFRGELPNKVYHTETGEMVDYTNKPGEIGFSALDIGRFLVWMRILKNRYPYLANSVDGVLLRWNYSNVIDDQGRLRGARVDADGVTQYVQEGRLGYEEYAAKGFELWGFETAYARDAEPFAFADVCGVAVPYDSRDPRFFHSQNYVVTEGYVLDGLELNWDLPDDLSSDDATHTDGWRALFADRVYEAQECRYRTEGYLTARSEHNVAGPPYFVYDSVYASGYAWNTLSPRGEYSPDLAAIATKAAYALWALWDTPYTDQLMAAVGGLSDAERGYLEGLYENGDGPIEIFTANNNGILLAALLHKQQGKILTAPTSDAAEVWYTKFRDSEIRERKNLPNPPAELTTTSIEQ